jgi:hypothetical protein
MSGIEILGIAASVLQIADLGGRLSVKLQKNLDITILDITIFGL